MTTQLLRFAAITALAALSTANRSYGQEPLVPEPLPPETEASYGVEPWTEGTIFDAVKQSAAGATIPMSLYPLVSTKDNTGRIVALVGGNPLVAGPTPMTIDAVVIPLVIAIGSSVFDPTAKNSCDGDVSALTRFKESPLVVDSKQEFNGVNVGTYQYINGFMRAEFWGQIHGASTYSNAIKWSYAAPLPPFAPGSLGIVSGTGCSALGIVNKAWLDSTLKAWIPLLQSIGVISPTKLAVFLLNNVVQSSANPPTVAKCCIYGYHSAIGNPVQTYSPMVYDTTGRIPSDVSVPAHELGEWMNDPLGNNSTPPWGHIGQVSKCQGNFEVGDPLTGTNMPTITLSGHPYHVQELAFLSWYYNANGTPSLGTGGEFSSHGTFEGPSQPCPPGGTF